MPAAGSGRRSRSRSPAPCGCCGDPEGDGARRRRRRPHARRTASCGCPAGDDADDAECSGSGSRRYWTGSPPRTPPDWRDSFQQLRRRWSDEARRRCTRRGSQDRARPANPSPGEIRALAGHNRPGAQPEYAASGPDPAPWTPEAQAATQPTLQQRLAELQRWQEATLRVSVEAVEPTSGSHFSLAACWDPDSSPNTLISSTGSNPPARRDTARASAIGPPPAVEPGDSSSASSSSSGSSQGSGSESDSGDELEDPLEQVWQEVDEVLEHQPIDKDEARAEVESILRASVLSTAEKLAVINAALEESAKDPEERRQTAKSMLRRSTRGAREVSDTEVPERESCRQVRFSSGARRSSRGSRVHSLVQEFEEEGTNVPRVSESRRRTTRRSTLRRDPGTSTRIGDDAEGRHSRRGRSVAWSRGSNALVPVDSRKSSLRAAVVDTEEGRRKSEQRQTAFSHKLGSTFGKSVSVAPKSVYYEAQLAPRPSHRRSTRRSSPRRAGSSVLREANGSAADDSLGAYVGREARHSTRSTENRSMEAVESEESEDEVRTSVRHSSGAGARRSSARRSSNVHRDSHCRRSVNDGDDELLPTRSLSTRKPTGWVRHSSSADTEAEEWATARHSGEGSFRNATVDDTHRHSHRRSSRHSTHNEPGDARGSRAEGHRGTISDIDEYSSEEETRESTSRTSFVEEGDPAERHRWSSRRRDDEDDEGGAGVPVMSHRHSGRKSSARRGTYANYDQSSNQRKRSNRNGMDERDAETHCCCVAGDHASYPSSRASSSRLCSCVSSDQLSSASDVCCCRTAACEAASRPGVGDVRGSEECCCRSLDALPSVARGECICYCEGRGVSAPEMSIVAEGGATCKAAAREGGIRKRDLEVDMCCECLGAEERREVCPAVAPCKAAVEEPTCLCDRPTPKKKQARKQEVAIRRRWGWWLRYVPLLVAALLWLFCVWWLCGLLRPLFLPHHCRPSTKSCVFWKHK